MDDCIFCKIIKGEIPAYKIYEDDEVFAFLDINGKTTGHTLVVPKKHFKNILDVEEIYLNKTINAVKKIAKHYVDDLGFTGFNLQVNNGESAGQEVPHLHFHILPRGNDSIKGMPLQEICKVLKL